MISEDPERVKRNVMLSFWKKNTLYYITFITFKILCEVGYFSNQNFHGHLLLLTQTTEGMSSEFFKYYSWKTNPDGHGILLYYSGQKSTWLCLIFYYFLIHFPDLWNLFSNSWLGRTLFRMRRIEPSSCTWTFLYPW